MKAFYKRPGSPPKIEDVAEPICKEGWVIISPTVVGLCRTDIYIASELIWRPNSLILGHEFCGIIIESKSNLWKEGDRVTIDPLWENRKKFMGVHFDGALAEKVSVPEDKVYLSDPDLSDELVAYAEPVAASLATSKLLLQGKGAIYGGNRIADLTALVLKSRGISIPILNENDPIPEEEYDYIIETVLRPGDGKKLCWGLKNGGSLILKSRKAEEVSFPTNTMVLKDLSLHSVSYGDWNSVMPWIKNNKKELGELIGETFPFEKCSEAFHFAQFNNNNKTFIKCVG